jgi:hypothetical protein
MPKKILPRIVAVTADKKPLVLRIQWAKGGENRIDVSGLITVVAWWPITSKARSLFHASSL